MNSTGYRHRRSNSSDRFLSVFTFSTDSSGGGDELNEAEVFWTTDFTEEPNHFHEQHHHQNDDHHRRLTFQNPTNYGILAALLPEEGDEHGGSRTLGDGPVLCRKPSISSSSSSSSSSLSSAKSIPRPPPPERELLSKSVQSRKFQHQSAPMNVPVLSKKNRNGLMADLDDYDDGDNEMLPPHEIVARGSGVTPTTTFSVLEGVGRTLKGRDLRQVRNAIWRKTGFLD